MIYYLTTTTPTIKRMEDLFSEETVVLGRRWSETQQTDLFRLTILLSRYRSCDDTQGSICFHNWTFSCSHVVVLMNTTKVQTSLVSSHDVYWEKVTVAPTGKASFVYSYVQTRLRSQCNGKWLFGLVYVLKPLITVIRAIGITRVDEGQISTAWKVQR